MTQQQINIAIAEWCGWKMKCSEAEAGNWKSKDQWCDDPNGCSTAKTQIPDYLNDLNAMHEVVSNLMDGQLMGYVEQLLCVIHQVDTGYFSRVGWGEASDLITATPAQRAEALLRTLNLWRDE